MLDVLEERQSYTLLQGDARQVLQTLPESSVQCVVTSPPYWGLRDYSRCECAIRVRLPGDRGKEGDIQPPGSSASLAYHQTEPNPYCHKCHGTGKDDSLNVVWGGEDCEHDFILEEKKAESTANVHWQHETGGGTHKNRYSGLPNPREAIEKDRVFTKVSQGFCSLCHAWRGQLGLEPTPELYVQHIVEVFQEVRRVLRDDGTLWLNMGDCYAGTGTRDQEARPPGVPSGWVNQSGGYPGTKATGGLKPKDLVGMPWRVAFALQADGWWLRSDIIWAKPNPMPESVTDRPTRAHEYVFLLTKKARYFYDADAVRESDKKPDGWKHIPESKDYHLGDAPYAAETAKTSNPQSVTSLHRQKGGVYNPAGRNKRTVWEITTQPYPEAHFATFPEKLVEPCIKAGTPEKGSCSVCWSPWERVVESSRSFESGSGRSGHIPSGKHGPFLQGGGETVDIRRGPVLRNTTTGFRPTCDHNPATSTPAIVLDPFCGSGTAGHVAIGNGRRFLGIDIKAEFLSMAEKRLRGFPVRLDYFEDS